MSISKLDGQTFSAEIVHETALASLNDEFAKIVTTEFLKKIFDIKKKTKA